MRTRTHRIQVWLNDEEYEQLKKDVEKTPYAREVFVRLLIEHNRVMECPKDYTDFKVDMWKISDELQDFAWKHSLTNEEKDFYNGVVKKLGKVLSLLEDVYFPYFKWKQQYAKQVIGFDRLGRIEKEEKTDDC